MPQLFRNFSASSTLSLATTSTHSSQTFLASDVCGEEEPVFGPETREDSEYRDGLRLNLLAAWCQVSQDYKAAMSGEDMVAPHVWKSHPRLINLARCEDRVLHSDHSSRTSTSLTDSDTLKQSTTTSIVMMLDIKYRTTVDALRQAQLMKVFGICGNLINDTDDDQTTAMQSPNHSITRKKCAALSLQADDRFRPVSSPHFTPARLAGTRQASTDRIDPQANFLLPCEIVLKLSKINPRYSMMWQATDKQAVYGEEEQLSCIKATDIAEDDGVPSYDNPFSSLFGKVKTIPLLRDDTEERWSRHIRSRFLVHELLRSNLMRVLPEYRKFGNTAQDAASSLMTELLRSFESDDVGADVAEQSSPKPIDEDQVYAIAILQGFIDRCNREGW